MKALHRWWFEPRSPVALGLFRAVFGLVAFTSMLMVLVDLDAWFSRDGFVPPGLGMTWLGEGVRFNPLGQVQSDGLVLAVYLVTTVAALTLALGWLTRISAVTFALGLLALHHRNPFILHSGDTLLRCSALYLAVSPCGAACSVDRLIGLWKGTAPAVPEPVPVWSQRLIQYQTALVYGTTLWWKMYGTYWLDGTATWYPANLREFDRFPVPAFLDSLPMVKATTYFTLAIELLLATAVFWKPLRTPILLGGLALHAMIEYRFNIPLFAFTITSTYLCFYDGEEVSAWAGRMAARLKGWRVSLGGAWREGPRAALAAAAPFQLVALEAGGDGTATQVWTRSPALWLFTPWGVARLLARAKEKAV